MDNTIYLPANRFPLVRDIGWNKTDSLYTHPNRLLNYDVFLFVVEGQMQVIEADQEYIVAKNQHLFLKNGVHHWGKAATLPGTAWYWIHFTTIIDTDSGNIRSSLVPELEYYFPDHYQYVFPLPKHGDAALHHSTEEQLQIMLQDRDKSLEHRMTDISMKAYQLFLNLHRSYEHREHRKASSKSGKAEAHVARIMNYLNQHAEQDFDSKGVSSYMNLNYSHLSATFSRLTGQTIVEAHTRLRINKALHLLRTTNLNVSETSEALGFQNPFYFTRVFKKVIGQSPSSYMSHLYHQQR